MSQHLSANGVGADVRDGWEVEFAELDGRPGSPKRSLVHLANFALPVERGDYGSGAVEIMDGGGILMVLMEFDATSGQTPMFSGTEVPTALTTDDFSAAALQRRLPGQAGAQRFFRVAGGSRAFGLYVVLGSLRSASLLVPEVNRSMAGVTIA